MLEDKRKELKKFLLNKTNYNSSKLLAKVQDSFLDDEEIILLMKDGRQTEALAKYIDGEKFDEAEEFCTNNQDSEQLLT